MKKKMTILYGVLCFAPALWAANLPLANANVQTLKAEPRFEGQINRLVKQSREPAWIGYRVPIIAGQRLGCYRESGSHCRCNLENKNEYFGFQDRQNEGQGTDLLIFIRAAEGEVEKIRVFSETCEIDAGGRTVYELVGVDSEKSLAMLAGWIEQDDGRGVTDGAMAALALHADTLADRYLEGFVSEGNSPKLREKAIFWTGNTRGRTGFEILRDLASRELDPKIREKITFGFHVSDLPEARDAMMDMARADESDKVRGQALFWLSQRGGEDVAALIGQVLENSPSNHELDQAIFALSQMPEDQGIDKLIEIARSHANGKARERALFWLGQKAGEKAIQTISEAVEEDPEVEVKKQAVFALSQMPKEEGVPMLLKIARTHPHPDVRKQAFFWLGQSGAKEALSLFEEVLQQ